jgi:hypothetical protein
VVIVVAVVVVVELEVVYAICVIEFEVVAALIIAVVAVDVEPSPFAMSRLILLIPAPFSAPIGRKNKKLFFCIFLFYLIIIFKIYNLYPHL